MELQDYRRKIGVSQETCAKAVGLTSKSYICGIERGTVTASLRVALKIERWSNGEVSATSLSPEAAELAQTEAA